MKKLLVLCAVLLPSLTALTGQDLKAVADAIHRAAITYPSSFSKEESVLKLSFSTQEIEQVDDVDMSGETAYFTHNHSYECPAVKILDNWLAVSSACVRKSEGTYTSFKLEGKPLDYDGRSDGKSADKMYGRIYGLNNFQVSALLILVPHREDSSLSKRLASLPQANLMILSNGESAQDISQLDRAFFINRNRFITPGRTVAEVKPDLSCAQNGCMLTLKNKFIDGDLGDPLFSVAKNNQEFLLGFNVSRSGISGKSGAKYQLFSQQDWDFMYKTVYSQTRDLAAKLKQKTVTQSYVAIN